MKDINDIKPQDVVAWLRSRAKKQNDMADLLEGDFEASPIFRINKRPSSEVSRTGGTVTVEQLEKRIKEKKGRLKDLAAHFAVEDSVISALLEPASKVYLGERGWLKLRE
jgi:hypothetical protein